MKNFIIFFNANEGSSAITETLRQFKDIQILGFEPFDYYQFCDVNRGGKGEDISIDTFIELLKLLYSKSEDAKAKFVDLYSQFSNNKLSPKQKPVIGFKMRTQRPWVKEIAPYLNENRIHAFFLFRKDIIKQALSFYKGQELQFAVARGELNSNKIGRTEYCLSQLEEIILKLREKLEQRRKLFCEFKSLGVATDGIFYENFLYEKERFLKNFLRKIELKVKHTEIARVCKVPIRFQKVHPDNLQRMALNYSEIEKRFEQEVENSRNISRHYNKGVLLGKLSQIFSS